ncbi:NAD(P)-binding protein [Clavulina sp. PMI_390]|nr:NAD(P)-binding protein [Clavulina sp. PMI_390]
MAQAELPTETRALVLQKSTNGPFVYDAVIATLPIPPLTEGQVLVRIGAAGFNHRDLWQRKNLYPGTAPGSPLGGGVVIAAYDPNDPLLREKVMLVPIRNWESDPRAPEGRFWLVGGGPPGGSFSEFVVVDRHYVIPVPPHMPLIYAAAWPVGGLTAWRALKINAEVKAGDNVLITGIGGGVALIALQLAVAFGANVYVTSSSPLKISKAGEMGARGGVNYKAENWPKLLGELLVQAGGKPTLDAVIDSAGGDIVGQLGKLLSPGARVVIYGMTVAPEVKIRMTDVLRNIQIKGMIISTGSTMGSRQDLIDATDFIAKHRINPEVTNVLRGLEEAEEGFRILQDGDRMGKIVMKFPGRTPEGDVRL